MRLLECQKPLNSPGQLVSQIFVYIYIIFFLAKVFCYVIE